MKTDQSQRKIGDNNRRVAVLGGGISGLAVAWFLSKKHSFEVYVIEKAPQLGGLSTTLKRGEISFDLGPHKIYTQIPHIIDELESLLGDDLIKIPKKSSVYIRNKFFNYPIVVKDLITGLSPAISIKLAASFLISTLRNLKSQESEVTYQEYVVRRFGNALYQLIFKPQATKLWGDPSEISSELARTRISFPSLIELIKGIFIGFKEKPEMSAEHFYYPKKGIIQISEAMADQLVLSGGNIYSNTFAEGINFSGENPVITLKKQGGKREELQCDMVVSTIPISNLINITHPLPEEKVVNSAKQLRFLSLILVYVTLDKCRLRDDAWVFYPESEIIFNRTFEQKAFSPYMVPENKTIVCSEVSCAPGDKQWNMSDDLITQKVINNLEKIGMIEKKDILDQFVIRLEDVYPVYDLNFRKNLDTVLEFVDSKDRLITTGRPGLFNYCNIDHCIDMGKLTADYIDEGRKSGQAWREVRTAFSNYRIVD